MNAFTSVRPIYRSFRYVVAVTALQFAALPVGIALARYALIALGLRAPSWQWYWREWPYVVGIWFPLVFAFHAGLWWLSRRPYHEGHTETEA